MQKLNLRKASWHEAFLYVILVSNLSMRVQIALNVTTKHLLTKMVPMPYLTFYINSCPLLVPWGAICLTITYLYR